MATKEELSAAAQAYAAADVELRKAHEDLAAAKERVALASARRKTHESALQAMVFGGVSVRTWPVWDGPSTNRTSRVVVVRRYGDGILVDLVDLEPDSEGTRPNAQTRPAAGAGS